MATTSIRLQLRADDETELAAVTHLSCLDARWLAQLLVQMADQLDRDVRT